MTAHLLSKCTSKHISRDLPKRFGTNGLAAIKTWCQVSCHSLVTQQVTFAALQMCFKALVQGQELVQIRLDHQQIHFATRIGQAALLDPGGQGASLLTDEGCPHKLV